MMVRQAHARVRRERRRRNDQSGFTLIEMLVAMGIMMIVMTIVFASITQLFESFENRNRDLVAQQQLSLVSANLGRYLR